MLDHHSEDGVCRVPVALNNSRGDTMSEAKCVFCEIAAGRAPAHIVHQNDLSLAILDIHPYTKGHCLVIPRPVSYTHLTLPTIYSV